MLWKHHSDSLQASPHIIFFSTEKAPKQSNYFALQLFFFEIILQLFAPPRSSTRAALFYLALQT